MANATSEHKRKANRAAAIVTACVVAFVGVFLGAIALLDYLGPKEQPMQIDVSIEAPQDTFYVLLIGSDTRKGTALYTGKATDHAQVDQHSDVMTLMRVDPKRYKISFLSIPRDTVISGENDKLNNALLNNDPTEVVDAVKRLTGLKADYYMMTTFATFADLIDALGGVDVDVPADVSVDDPATGANVKLKAGKNQHLDGAKALALARARHEYGDNQDVIRQSNVRAIEAAIIDRVLSYHSIEDVEKLLTVVNDDVKTNMDLPTVGLAMVDFMNHADKVTILGGSGPYEGGGARKSDGQWVIPEDEKSWKEVMKVFKQGKDPTTVIALPKQNVDDGKSQSSASASSTASSKSSAAASSKSSGSSSASANKSEG